MNVVGHQTISESRNIILHTIKFKPFQINKAIIICKEDLISPITALSNVMGDIGKYISSDSRLD